MVLGDQRPHFASRHLQVIFCGVKVRAHAGYIAADCFHIVGAGFGVQLVFHFGIHGCQLRRVVVANLLGFLPRFFQLTPRDLQTVGHHG